MKTTTVFLSYFHRGWHNKHILLLDVKNNEMYAIWADPDGVYAIDLLQFNQQQINLEEIGIEYKYVGYGRYKLQIPDDRYIISYNIKRITRNIISVKITSTLMLIFELDYGYCFAVKYLDMCYYDYYLIYNKKNIVNKIIDGVVFNNHDFDINDLPVNINSANVFTDTIKIRNGEISIKAPKISGINYIISRTIGNIFSKSTKIIPGIYYNDQTNTLIVGNNIYYLGNKRSFYFTEILYEFSNIISKSKRYSVYKRFNTVVIIDKYQGFYITIVKYKDQYFEYESYISKNIEYNEYVKRKILMKSLEQIKKKIEYYKRVYIFNNLTDDEILNLVKKIDKFTMNDSIEVGNCEYGTYNYLKSIGIKDVNERKYITGEELAKHLNEHKNYLRNQYFLNVLYNVLKKNNIPIESKS